MTNAERYNLSAAVFTALTDVELEIDGLMSYDRAVIKMGAQPLNQIHTQLIQASSALNNGPTGQLYKICICTSRASAQVCIMSPRQPHVCKYVCIFALYIYAYPAHR